MCTCDSRRGSSEQLWPKKHTIIVIMKVSMLPLKISNGTNMKVSMLPLKTSNGTNMKVSILPLKTSNGTNRWWNAQCTRHVMFSDINQEAEKEGKKGFSTGHEGLSGDEGSTVQAAIYLEVHIYCKCWWHWKPPHFLDSWPKRGSATSSSQAQPISEEVNCGAWEPLLFRP